MLNHRLPGEGPKAELPVRGYQSKDRLCEPNRKGSGRAITFPGRKLFMESSGTDTPRDGAVPREPKCS